MRQSSQDPLRDMIGMCIDLILYIQRLGSRGPVLTEILEVTDYDELNMRYELNCLKKKEQSEEVMDLDA